MKTTFKKSTTIFGCYEKQQVDKLLPNDDFTIEDVLNADVSFKDKFWFVINNCKLTDKQQKQLAVNIAYVVLPTFEENHPKDDRPRKCYEVTRAYLDGNATEEELLIVRSAAFDAVYDYYDLADECDAAYAAYAAYYAADLYTSNAARSAYYAAILSNEYCHYKAELNKVLKEFFNK